MKRTYDGHHWFYVAYQHVRELVASFWTGGWRHTFPWSLTLVIGWAYFNGVYDPGLNLEPYNNLAWFVLFAFMWRGGVDKGGLAPFVEAIFAKRFGAVFPGAEGGLVNNAAIETPPRGGQVG